MYIPAGSTTLDKIVDTPQIRLGIQGFSGVGKTWSGTTFPNPVFLSLNRGLGAHIGRADITEVRLYDPSVIDTYAKRSKPTVPNQKDAVMNWLEKEGMKLEAGQTLIVDNSTELENAFHREQDLNPEMTQYGKVDDRAPWRNKIKYFGDMFAIFQYLKCHVIYIAHESESKNKDGSYSGKIRPLMTGQTVDRMVGAFTDWFRQHAINKPKDDAEMAKAMESFGYKDKKAFIERLSKFPRNTIYYWQTESDDLCDCKSSTMVNFPRCIFADFNDFKQYMRTISPAK